MNWNSIMASLPAAALKSLMNFITMSCSTDPGCAAVPSFHTSFADAGTAANAATAATTAPMTRLLIFMLSPSTLLE